MIKNLFQRHPYGYSIQKDKNGCIANASTIKSVKLLFTLFFSSLILLGCIHNNPQIVIETELGNITLELYPQKAPLTVANFLKYIQEDRLGDATFYRTVSLVNQPGNKVKIEVIQGGLYEDAHPQMLAPIRHETTKTTGILHKDGVISMARNEPGTATSEFFICIGDQPSLDFGGNRNSDGQGFAAFGKVIDGMDVVHKIQQSPAEGQWLKPKVKIINVEVLDECF